MAKKAVKRVTTPKRAANTAAAKKAEAAKKKAENDEKTIDKNESGEQSDKSEPVKPEKSEKQEQVVSEKTVKKEGAKPEHKNKKSNDPAPEVEEDDNGEENSEKMEVDTENKIDEESVNVSTADSTNPDESIEETDNNESTALNILIGEDEENLLLNSGEDEPADKSTGSKKESSQNESKDTTNEETDQKKDGEQKDKETTEKTSESDKADSKSDKPNESTTDGKADDEKNKNKNNQQGRSLWVTNLLPSTRAQELKHLLSRYGKVIGAKIVQSSRNPRTRCYGYVTMESKTAADHCIKKLNNTELKGQIIRVAKVRPEHSIPLKSGSEVKDNVDKSKPSDKPKTEEKDKPKEEKPEKKPDEKKPEEKTKEDQEKKKDDGTKKDSKERDARLSRSSSRKDPSVDTSTRRDKRTDVLTFDKIREERDRHRARERERATREEEKRRRDVERCREIERNQQYEARRLEREREKLRAERERLDKQRQEILRLERERQKLEREKLEREKDELRRQQMRLEEARRPIKRPASTSSNSYRREATGYPDDRKREAREDRHYEEAPPPPRFDVTPREPTRDAPKKEIEKDYKAHLSYTKHTEDYPKRSDYKREFPTSDRHYSSSHLVAPNGGSSSQYVSREREIREPRREPIPPVGPPKITSDVRYSERATDRSPVPYRGPRDDRERRPIADHHPKPDIRPSRDAREHRYGEPSAKEPGRFREGGSWHSSGPSPPQPFLGGPNGSSRDSWNKSDSWRPMESTSERWAGNTSSRLLMSGSAAGTLYSSGGSTGLSCPPPPGSSGYAMDRFENYKSMNNARKY